LDPFEKVNFEKPGKQFSGAVRGWDQSLSSYARSTGLNFSSPAGGVAVHVEFAKANFEKAGYISLYRCKGWNQAHFQAMGQVAQPHRGEVQHLHEARVEAQAEGDVHGGRVVAVQVEFESSKLWNQDITG
jgi:hypothetical protein